MDLIGLVSLASALEDFGLDQSMFDQMDKKDLKIFIESALGSVITKIKLSNANVLLKAKGCSQLSKKVRICEPSKLNIPKTARARSSSIEYNNLAPTSQSIDVLFGSLVTCNSINTFI